MQDKQYRHENWFIQKFKQNWDLPSNISIAGSPVRSTCFPEMYLLKISDKSIEDTQSIGDLKICGEKHNVEKIAIALLTVKAGSIAY